MQITNKFCDMKYGKNIFTNKKNIISVKIFIVLFIIVLCVALLNLFNLQIKNFFYLISQPAEKSFLFAGQATSGFLSSILNSSGIISENQNLKSENHKLLSQIALLESALKSSDAQRQISEIYQNSGFNLISAGLAGLSGKDEITIDKGSDDGIEEGMPVISRQNYLFGKVSQVYKNFSKVSLISSQNSTINVKLLRTGESGDIEEIYGVVKGDGGLGAHLDLIPVDKTIYENEVLVTSAIDGTFPKNLLAGEINQVEKNDQNPHQKAKIRLFIDLTSENLFLISNYKK